MEEKFEKGRKVRTSDGSIRYVLMGNYTIGKAQL